MTKGHAPLTSIHIRALLLCGFALTVTPALSQVPENLSAKKDFLSGRASSIDPNHKNGDARPIDPGQTLQLADIKGPGRITHIWFTISSPSKDHLRELILRFTWDDAK